jgi:hypothetical protein
MINKSHTEKIKIKDIIIKPVQSKRQSKRQPILKLRKQSRRQPILQLRKQSIRQLRQQPIRQLRQPPTKQELIKKQLDIDLNDIKKIIQSDFKVLKNSEILETMHDNIEDNSLTITYETIKDKINDDKFINKILTSEKIFLYKKLVNYNKIYKLVQNDLDYLKKQYYGITKTEVEQNEIDNLKKELNKINLFVEKINKRIKILEKDEPDLHKTKKEQLLNIIDNKDLGIASLIGKARKELRETLYSIIVLFAQLPFFFLDKYLNFIITGKSGIGKTKFVEVASYMFSKLGILISNRKPKITSAKSFISNHIGETAIKTLSLLNSALENVLFLDEAYQLTGCPDKDNNFDSGEFKGDAIVELLLFLDKYRGMIIMITAGYYDKMYKCFLNFNEGLNRRFPYKLNLQDYKSSDLFNILMVFIKKNFGNEDPFTKSQSDYINLLIKKLNKMKLFDKQAGDMENLAAIIIQDIALVSINNIPYNKDKISNSFKKFLLNKNIKNID